MQNHLPRKENFYVPKPALPRLRQIIGEQLAASVRGLLPDPAW